MPSQEGNQGTDVPDDLAKAGYKRTDASHDLGAVLQELDVYTGQTRKRRKLLKELESLLDPRKKAGVLSFVGMGAMGVEDVPAVGDALKHVGDVEVLTLIIDSPGGDGNAAEKLVTLCRAYCSKFRVVIPHRAKSAATIVALGADEVGMGFCSELGPIDAQVPVMSGGLLQLISAQAFIDAKERLEADYQECLKEKKDPRAILQEIATLDLPFIQHCQSLMEFSRDVAGRFLTKHMFRDLSPEEVNARTNKVLDGLSSVKEFKVHGRMIDGQKAKELGLNVRLLGRDDPIWQKIWGYYLRATRTPTDAGVIVETKNSTLVRGRPRPG